MTNTKKQDLPAISQKTTKRNDLPVISQKTTKRNDLPVISQKTTKRNDLPAISQKTTKRNDLPAISQKTTKRNDFIEIKFTGYANNEVFDSNIEEDLKKINPDAKPKKTIVIIGEGMVVRGFDRALEDKEIGKEYTIELKPKEAFGNRDRNLIKTIPLTSFTQQKVAPRQGMVLALDNAIVKILAVSGARVTADFNNLLAGKEIKYKFIIEKIITDEKEKTEALLQTYLHSVPEFEIKEKEIMVWGTESIKSFVEVYKEKFKELIGKEIKFELKAEGEKKDT